MRHSRNKAEFLKVEEESGQKLAIDKNMGADDEFGYLTTQAFELIRLMIRHTSGLYEHPIICRSLQVYPLPGLNMLSSDTLRKRQDKQRITYQLDQNIVVTKPSP